MSRTLRISVGLVLALALAAVPATGAAAQDLDLEIPYQKFVLDNGLTLLVHEDHKAPIAAVNVWYHVGSKNEPAGRSGFAHLFEHLMFNGSENFDTDYFKGIQDVGATDVNGTTNEDRTNYFQNVPVTALDRVLFLESDRMGHLLGAVNQDKLDEQRGVVQNEKRQGENEPYAVAYELITEAAFPEGHPYAHTVIGSMEDLDAAAVEDVHEWFETYYGPNNAVLVIAGDVDAEQVHQKVQQYFGDIPPGPPVAKWQEWIAERDENRRQVVQDRVPQARTYMVWNVPGRMSEDVAYLDLLSDVLTQGKSSRLYKRLVYDDRIATDVMAYLDAREIASLFTIQATAVPGGDLAAVEKAIAEEVERLLADGPTKAEVERAVNSHVAGFTRGAERIGGFGGKSDILAGCQVYTGDPECWKTRLTRNAAATPAKLRDAGRRWLADGRYTLAVMPYPEVKATAEGVDRSELPTPGESPEPAFPKMERAEIGNGLDLVVAERHAMPVVNLSLLVDSGYAADQHHAPGTASFAMSVLDEGTAKRDALQISDELRRLGATLFAGADLDTATVSMSTLKSNLDESLALFADVVLSPAFPQNEVERLKAERVAAIQREKVSPVPMALRVLPRLMYGADHAYGTPLTGSGTIEAVQQLGRDDLARFHQTWFKPNNATLVVVGDTTMAEIRPKIEALFRGWQRGDVPAKNVVPVTLPEAKTVYLVDRPGSIQSVVLAGLVVPPKSDPRDLALDVANEALGGGFVSRLNMNLREDKGWAYGAGAFMFDARGQRPWIAFAPVQADQTGPSMAEVLKEVREITSSRPVEDAELNRIRTDRVLSLPGSWETSGEVSGAIQEMVRYDLPSDYWQQYPTKLEGLTLSSVNQGLQGGIDASRLVWVVVGDRAKVEQQIRDAGFTDIRLLDADGNPVVRFEP
ncbi:MAG TPA: pitrilysin family protein [Thermoanaerobaculia bacterium]|nr:pitrilysin family protein [Thermoanaerobaculia bacterium]